VCVCERGGQWLIVESESVLRRAATFRTHTKTQNNNDVQRFSPTQSYGKESLSEETVARGKGLAMAMGRTVAVNCAFLYFSLRACSLLAVIAMVK
jgi:hypothetical protein